MKYAFRILLTSIVVVFIIILWILGNCFVIAWDFGFQRAIPPRDLYDTIVDFIREEFGRVEK